jgi:hypothetical protein
LTGYFYKQVTNDSLNGSPVATVNADGSQCVGYKGRVLDLGPQVTFPSGKHGALLIKWDYDVLVQNKPRGTPRPGDSSFEIFYSDSNQQLFQRRPQRNALSRVEVECSSISRRV